jgi:hypothetical protein
VTGRGARTGRMREAGAASFIIIRRSLMGFTPFIRSAFSVGWWDEISPVRFSEATGAGMSGPAPTRRVQAAAASSTSHRGCCGL